jgi:uncharacterized protein YecT (DUF1311 family)
MAGKGAIWLAAVFWASTAHAQDNTQAAPPSATLNCETAEAQTDLDTCASMDFTEADSDLNDAYQAALTRMQALDAALPKDQQGAVAALKDAQRTWITFRDQACAAEGWTVHGGSMEPMVVLECKARVTAARSDDLWSLGAPPDANP